LTEVPEYAAELVAALAITRTRKEKDPFMSGKARQFYDADMLELEKRSKKSEDTKDKLELKPSDK
jgi:hypothetical protein